MCEIVYNQRQEEKVRSHSLLVKVALKVDAKELQKAFDEYVSSVLVNSEEIRKAREIWLEEQTLNLQNQVIMVGKK